MRRPPNGAQKKENAVPAPEQGEGEVAEMLKITNRAKRMTTARGEPGEPYAQRRPAIRRLKCGRFSSGPPHEETRRYCSQDIANRIKARAKAQGKSIGWLLSSCGLGKNTVSKIRQGKDILTLNFAKIADALGCSVEYLLGRTDDEP